MIICVNDLNWVVSRKHDDTQILKVDKNESTTERGKILLGLVYNVQQGSLFVEIKRCTELVGMDPTGFSDPYVKLYVFAQNFHRFSFIISGE